MATTTALSVLPLRTSISSSSSPKSPSLSIPPKSASLITSLHRNSQSLAIVVAAVNEPRSDAAASSLADDGNGVGVGGGGEEIRLLTAVRSEYNDIMILDTPESRVLLLDDSYNIHSILYKQQEWTDSYWDEFVSLPAIIPEGPIAIFGLGGGTVAHLLLRSWPSLQLDGWELDDILIDKAREHFGLSDLEKYSEAGGILHVKIGDALSSSCNIPGGYAGIIVDLFADGKVLPQLEKPETWRELSSKMMANGRIMVNCGGCSYRSPYKMNELHHSELLIDERDWVHHPTIKAMYDAFGGQVNWKRMPDTSSDNYLALTGCLPDLTSWADSVPSKLASSVKLWKFCVYSEC